ncbi:hypothetical protein [Microvirga sesbaniae]|nr:hypothetical protein [Microvirga sp. HBU67692]
MSHNESSHDNSSEPENGTDAAPSFQRASILFAASLGSFIGASLLLASL